jgi:hypothetical protein
VSLQSLVGAWLAVHALAKRGIGRTFGVVETAYPTLIKQETQHRLDDVQVELSNGGRLFPQVTRQPTQAKVADFLEQATDTWLEHKTPTGIEFKKSLKRGEDALVLMVPTSARQTLDALEQLFRKFDGFDRWSDVPLVGSTKLERQELTKAKATITARSKTATSKGPTDHELVEMFGLIKIVRLDLDHGMNDERNALSILQDGVGLSTTDSSRAWDRLVRTNVDWMQTKSGASRDGICRHLKAIGIDIEDTGKAVIRESVSLVASAAGTSDGLAQQLLMDAENRVPPHLAEPELRRLVKRARQRLGFNDPTVDYMKEISQIARRVINGDLCRASVDARCLAISYAARSAASTKEGIEAARKLIAVADQIAPGRNHVLVDAAIAMHESPDAVVKLLRDVKTPEARSQMAMAMKVSKGSEGTIAWLKAERFSAAQFNSAGAYNVTIMALQANDLKFAKSWASSVTEAQLDECPSLLALRADLNFATTLPVDEQPSVIISLPFDLRRVHPAQDAGSVEICQQAKVDLARVLTVARDLGLDSAAMLIEERLTWLEGLEPANIEAVKNRIAEGLKADPARWVRLALRFQIPFNRDELAAKLEAIRLSGGWNADEGGAHLLIEMESGKPDRVARFIGENRERLEASNFFNSLSLSSIEIEALARSGDTLSARKKLETDLQTAPAELKTMLQLGIEEYERKVDPVMAARIRFNKSGSTEDLGYLCNALHKAGQLDALIEPAAELARRVRNVADLRSAVSLLIDRGRHVDALNLLRGDADGWCR